jgi:hypothetical protein
MESSAVESTGNWAGGAGLCDGSFGHLVSFSVVENGAMAGLDFKMRRQQPEMAAGALFVALPALVVAVFLPTMRAGQ